MAFKVALILPTYNPGFQIRELFDSLKKQTLYLSSIVLIDSSSTDGSLQKLSEVINLMLFVIPKESFNHGKTRQLALELVDADIYIYLTQDAILANEDALKNLVTVFDDANIGCAYGRQMPHADANLLGAHLRQFNYPDRSEVRSMKDVSRLGIKACANSNSFAAYRKTALQAVGGFPSRVILGEDVYVAGKMLLAGWKVAYCADAKVLHSHNYTSFQDFCRYFDIGVFHREESWIIENFRSPQKVGQKYLISELKYCIQHKKYGMVFISLLHSTMKLLGYRLGFYCYCFPKVLCRFLSMHPFYWDAGDK